MSKSRSPKGQPKARLAPPGGWSKTPRTVVAGEIPTDKTPRRREFVPDSAGGRVVIQFGRFDVDGPWCLTKITESDHRALLQRIRSIETMTVSEAFNAGDEPGKDYDTEKIPNAEALRRLADLEYDDETQISRLRMSGVGRLYGFRRRDRFYALWWDPDHKIWPSLKKRT